MVKHSLVLLVALVGCGRPALSETGGKAAGVYMPIRHNPLGLITAVTGGVKVYQSTRGRWVKASAMQLVSAGDKVKVGPNGQATVALFGNGARYQLSPGAEAVLSPGNLKVEGPAAKMLPALNMRNAKLLSSSRVAEGRSGGVVVRGNQSDIELQSLSATSTLEPLPTFCWLAVPNAVSYKITLWNDIDEQIWQSEATTSPLTYPQNAPPLKPGVDYLWRVTTTVNDTRYKAEGVFRILPPDQRESLDQHLKALDEVQDESLAAILRAETYAKSKLWDNAISCYQALIAKEPESPVLHAILADLLAGQGRIGESRQHRKALEQLLKGEEKPQ